MEFIDQGHTALAAKVGLGPATPLRSKPLALLSFPGIPPSEQTGTVDSADDTKPR
jgi:hypothetical protein